MFPRDIVCLRNMSISTLHKGDDDDDNNNNNIVIIIRIWPTLQHAVAGCAMFITFNTLAGSFLSGSVVIGNATRYLCADCSSVTFACRQGIIPTQHSVSTQVRRKETLHHVFRTVNKHNSGLPAPAFIGCRPDAMRVSSRNFVST